MAQAATAEPNGDVTKTNGTNAASDKNAENESKSTPHGRSSKFSV